MAQATLTEVFNVDIENFYNVLVDYDSYPEFVDGMESVEVLKKSATSATVKFNLNLIKTFSYVLKLSHKKNAKVSWTLESGDLFKSNNGSWELKSVGKGKTEVTYSLDVEMKLFVPGMIVNKLVSKNMPATMKAYAKRAASL